MAVNLCAAHKKTDWHVAHEALLACFLQLCSTRRWIPCTHKIELACIHESLLSCHMRVRTESLEEHTRIAARECQLRHEWYRNISSFPIIYVIVSAKFLHANMQIWPIIQSLKPHNFVRSCSLSSYKSSLING